MVNEEFQKRRLFKHHHNSVWDHSIDVSLRAYKVARRYRADKRICAIAGLLHDFYPLAWQYSKELEEYNPKYLDRLSRKEPLLKKHGFTHAREATENYLIFFKEYENKRISNSIKRHMFPINIVPPRYMEGWVVSMADKKSSFKDSMHIIKGILFNTKKKNK